MATPPKGKEPAADSIMKPAAMKLLLAVSKQEPVQAAIAMTADGEGLMLLDKKAKPKKVLSMLRAEAAKAKITLNNSSLRFGRAEVDTDYDSGMIRLFINKEAPGSMRVKLVELAKRIPYQKVELNVLASLEEEEEEGETEETGASASAPSTPQPPPSGGPTAPVTGPQPDMAALSHELGELIRKIPSLPPADTAAKARAAKLATDANVNLKANNITTAVGLIGELRQLINGAAANAAPLAGWKAARNASITSLKAVAGKIAAAKHASSAPAIIELQAVIKNLTAEPSTLQQVTELQKWLGDDEVVADVCELAEDVRTPLLASLKHLHDQLTA